MQKTLGLVFVFVVSSVSLPLKGRSEPLSVPAKTASSDSASEDLYSEKTRSSDSSYSPTSYPGYIQSYRSGATTSLNLDQLLERFEHEKPKNLISLLKLLPEDYFKHYVALYKSRSLQEASFENPRVILFGNTAELMVSFNGSPSQKGYDRLEVIGFRQDSSSWELREFRQYKDEVRVSVANPPLCLKCHQSPERAGVDPRPNWEPYASWPGAYGSADGNLSSSLKQNVSSYAIHDGDASLFELQNQEYEQAKNWDKNIRGQHERYSLLQKLQPKNTLDLTDTLGEYNFRRVWRLMNLSPQNAQLLKETVGFLAKCRSGDYEVPFKQDFPLVKDIEPGIRRGTSRLDLLVSFWVWKLFGSKGRLTDDWSMDFGTQGRFAFSERFGVPTLAVSRLASAISTTDPDFITQTCSELKARAVAAWALAESTQDPPVLERLPPESASTPFKACLRCHAPSEQDEMALSFSGLIPRLPFDSPEALVRVLDRPRAGRLSLRQEIISRISKDAEFGKQMPPDHELSETERIGILTYLDQLAADSP